MVETVSTGLTLAKAGSFMDGIGSIASAFGIGGGGGFNSKDLAEQRTTSRKHTKRDYEQLPSAMVRGWQRAGIHPLAGITGNVNVSSPASIMDTTSSDMGQNISRAGKALQGISDRKYQDTMEQLSIERAKLENEILKGQATQVHRQNVPPAIPDQQSKYLVDGQGDGKLSTKADNMIEVLADAVTSKSAKNSGTTAGSHAFYETQDLGQGVQMKIPRKGEPESYGFIYSELKGLELLAKSAGVSVRELLTSLETSKREENRKKREQQIRKLLGKYAGKKWSDYK